jgi:hypothetical protein
MTELRLANGGVIYCLPASGATIRGLSGSVVFDEMSYLQTGQNDIFPAILPMISATPGARLIFLSSPGGQSGPFYEFFTNPEYDTGDWLKIKVLASQCPRIDPQQIEKFRVQLSPSAFKREVMAEFTNEGLGSYFSDDFINNLFELPGNDALDSIFGYTRDGKERPAPLYSS